MSLTFSRAVQRLNALGMVGLDHLLQEPSRTSCKRRVFGHFLLDHMPVRRRSCALAPGRFVLILQNLNARLAGVQKIDRLAGVLLHLARAHVGIDQFLDLGSYFRKLITS